MLTFRPYRRMGNRGANWSIILWDNQASVIYYTLNKESFYTTENKEANMLETRFWKCSSTVNVQGLMSRVEVRLVRALSASVECVHCLMFPNHQLHLGSYEDLLIQTSLLQSSLIHNFHNQDCNLLTAFPFSRYKNHYFCNKVPEKHGVFPYSVSSNEPPVLTKAKYWFLQFSPPS